MQQLVLVVKMIEDSLGQIEQCHCLKVGPLSRHTQVSHTIKFSCQVLRHISDTEYDDNDDDHHHHRKFNMTRL